MGIFENFKDERVTEKLERLRREAEERDARREAEAEGREYLDMSRISVSLDALRVIPEEKAREAGMAAVQMRKKELALVTANGNSPVAQAVIEDLRKRGYELRIFITSLTSIRENAWSRYKEIKEAPADSLSSVMVRPLEVSTVGSVAEKLAEEERAAGGVSTTSFINIVLSASIALGASDIHLEPKKEDALLRFRIDGILYDIYEMTFATYKLVLARMKLLSGLKINIADKPQDGRFTIKRDENDVEVRTSLIPSEHGETAVLRVLDPGAISLGMADLGFREEDEALVRRELKRPNGMVLVTGPTGSGKTTTLYAFLRHVRTPEKKVITIEDPIEYHLDGIEQTQVDPARGYTFGEGLRSILRQDPDVILVGEIRDLETAEIGIHASLTGHLVFSTLHTNNSLGAIPRLIDLGIKPSVIGPSLNVVIAQRLVRRLCPACRTAVELTGTEKEKVNGFLAHIPGPVAERFKSVTTNFKAVGCEKCRNGYKGRVGIYEIFDLRSGEFQSQITKEVSEEDLRKYAAEHGMIDMQSDGVLKVLRGETTFEEVERVTGPIPWFN